MQRIPKSKVVYCWKKNNTFFTTLLLVFFLNWQKESKTLKKKWVGWDAFGFGADFEGLQKGEKKKKVGSDGDWGYSTNLQVVYKSVKDRQLLLVCYLTVRGLMSAKELKRFCCIVRHLNREKWGGDLEVLKNIAAVSDWRGVCYSLPFPFFHFKSKKQL